MLVAYTASTHETTDINTHQHGVWEEQDDKVLVKI
jgi:hypothetical protein